MNESVGRRQRFDAQEAVKRIILRLGLAGGSGATDRERVNDRARNQPGFASRGPERTPGAQHWTLSGRS